MKIEEAIAEIDLSKMTEEVSGVVLVVLTAADCVAVGSTGMEDALKIAGLLDVAKHQILSLGWEHKKA